MHPLDRLFWIYSGKSIYSWVKPKPIKWRFVGDDGYEVCIGKTSKAWVKKTFPVTELRTCCMCGKTSTPKKVLHYTPFTYEQSKDLGIFHGPEKNTFCFSCINKLRPLRKALDQADQLRLQANRIRRKINESTKNNA